jgi:hypothetical protein
MQDLNQNQESLLKDSPAKTSVSPANAPDWLVSVAACIGKLSGSQTKPKRNGSSSKMSLDFSVPSAEGTWVLSSERWLNSGIASVGECWMLNTLESPSGGGVYSSLRAVLQQSVSDKYSLSAKAAAGILRRATKRGKTLPEQLQTALTQVVNQDVNSGHLLVREV